MDSTGTDRLKPLSSGLAQAVTTVEKALEGLLTSEALPDEIARPSLLMAAMRHGALVGGKRMRPFLVMETARLFSVAGEGPIRAAAALELVHCYSLVHDDLPAMDDDDLRRGQPTVHKLHDDAMGVLVGDGLLTLAFDVLADERTDPDPLVRNQLVRLLARRAGCGGMVGGQMLDLAAEGRYAGKIGMQAEEAQVTLIQAMKTGALIRAATAMGCLLGRSTAEQSLALDHYATGLGLAFQIKDDLLDVEGDAAALGKAARKDAAAGKATFVSLLGVDGARRRLQETSEEARTALAPFGEGAELLRLLLHFNAARRS